MARKLLTAQRPFRMLVANLTKGSDPSRGRSGNPVKARQTFTTQMCPEVVGKGYEFGEDLGPQTRTGYLRWTVDGVAVRGEAEITVVAFAFSGPTWIQIGNRRLTSGEDWATAGSVGATATNIAGAINALPEFSAAAVGAVVTVTGIAGPTGNKVAFYAGGATPQNFTLDPDNRSFAGAEPYIGSPEIT